MDFTKLKCKECNEEFMQHNAYQRYCSFDCRKINEKRRFLLDKNNNPQKYIEREKIYRKNIIKKCLERGIRVLSLEKLTCPKCQKIFTPYNGRQKYCSRTCGIILKTLIKCPICDEKFMPYNIYHKYCSHECGRKAEKLRMEKRIGYKPKMIVKCIYCKREFLRRGIKHKLCGRISCLNGFSAYRRREKSKIVGKEMYQKFKIKMKNNINIKLRVYLRARLGQILKPIGAKKSKHTMELVGCDIIFFRKYIESKFKPGMSWHNYRYNGWHIDHIRPICSFNLTKEEDQVKCFHYSNLQPLWWWENLQKSGKYEGIKNNK